MSVIKIVKKIGREEEVLVGTGMRVVRGRVVVVLVEQAAMMMIMKQEKICDQSN